MRILIACFVALVASLRAADSAPSDARHHPRALRAERSKRVSGDQAAPTPTGGGGGGAVDDASASFHDGSTTLEKIHDGLVSAVATTSTAQPKIPDSSLPNVATRPPTTEVVRSAQRFAALVVILEGLHELLDPLRSGNGDSYPAGGLLLLPHERDCWLHRDGRNCTCPVSGALHLEKLLADMPRVLRFHVRGWFVDVERRGRWVLRRRRPVRQRIVNRRPGAELGRARDGVEWLAAHWALRDARGELVEPWLVAPGLDRLAA
jgi:hypothetical protein